MPARIWEGKARQAEVTGQDYGYEYPDGLSLKPGTDLHDKIVGFVMERAQEAHETMKCRFPSWRKIDHTLTGFIPLDKEEKELKERDPRKPVSVVVPMTYALMETLLTYWTSVMLAGTIFQYDGAGPEDRYAAIMAEKLVEFQSVRLKHALNLHTQYRDALSYGFGVIATQWERRTRTDMLDIPRGINLPLLGFMPIQSWGAKQVQVEKLLHEGTRLSNIQTQMYLPDPNVPIHEPQRGEFVAWIHRDPFVSLLDEERHSQHLFNVQYLRHVKPAKSTLWAEKESGRYESSGIDTDSSQTTHPVDTITMCANIVPMDLGVGPSSYPEKWIFEVAGDCILIRMERLPYRHGMFPLAVCAPDYDGYSVAPMARLEITYPLQTVLDFQINMQVIEQRKASCDLLIADPSLVHIPSLENPEPGRIILLNEEAWGRGVQGAVEQLKLYQTTQQNIQNAMFLCDMIQRVVGAPESVQGLLKQKSESPTAREVDTAFTSAMNRLQKSVRIAAIQSHYDLAMQLAHNCQQYMTMAQYIAVTGRWEQVLRMEYGVIDPYLFIDPRVLEPDRDIIPHNGAIPSGQNVQGLIQWLQIISGIPAVVAQTDLGRLALHIGREMGVQNLEDFLLRGPIQTQVAPDEEVTAAAEAGNAVPIDEAINAGVV